MPNSSNSNSYLILYLIIILVLIYAITFMSGYTCNVSVQPNEALKPKENFSNYDEEEIEENEENDDNYNNSEYYPNGVPAYPYEDFESTNNQIENFETQGTWSGPQTGMDYPGNDIWSGGVGSTADCGNSCVGMPQCNAFTTNAAGNNCWLKGSLGSPSPNGDRNTYTITRPPPNVNLGSNWVGPENMDYPGNDIINMGVNNTQQCATACEQQPNSSCAGIVTNAAGNYCWLKGSFGQPVQNSDRMMYKYNKPAPGTLASPALTANDFTFIGVGNDNQLYVDDIIGGVWPPTWTLVQNSGNVVDVCVSPSGILYGIGTDSNLYSRQTLNSPWIQTQVEGSWKALSLKNDENTLLLVGQDTHLYTADLNSPTTSAILMSPDGFGFQKVIQAQNGSIYAVGLDSNLYYPNETMPTGYISSWAQYNPQISGIKSIAQAINGSFVLLGNNEKIYTTNNLSQGMNGLTLQPTCCFIGIGLMQIPPQTINGYDRKGAFVDNGSRPIPNYLGNFNTLPDCINAAQTQGYNTVGYQNMNQCFGGNNSAYDSFGFQKDTTLNVSAYPGAWTNIVYKTGSELVTTADPMEGEVFLYQACQFGGGGSKMTVGQYPNLNDSIEIRSIKVGPKTKLSLFSLPNFQGNSDVVHGYSDIVNKDAACIHFTFVSAKVEKSPNSYPYKPSDLTNAQLANLWTEVGCKAESMGFNATNITKWKSLNTINDVVNDIKKWATSTQPEIKQGCYTLAPQPNVPSEGEVVLFENCDYGGRYKKFGMGNVAFVGNDFNDITSSIKIGPYTSIIIYENINFGGKSASWKNDSDAVSNISCLTSNNFNDMLSSLKVTSSTAQVNYSLDLKASPVITLGLWNTAPWNVSTFADQNAQWIWWNKWNGQFPNGSAPIDPKPVRFQLLVPVSGNRDVPVVIHVIADNAPQGANFVKVN